MDSNGSAVLGQRRRQVYTKGQGPFRLECDVMSVPGAVSQRACTFCGSRVVLYPITDALHLVHGPVGCAAYTWDIRGALSSDRELHRLSFTTDLRERDVIFGGEEKLRRSLLELIARYAPSAAFVYSTCIVGIIGDDVEAVCRQVSEETKIPCIPVHSEGFRGSKRAGYQAACNALMQLVGIREPASTDGPAINILGDFNLAGEIWIIKEYYRKMGVSVVSTITGDGKVDEIAAAHGADLNVVQCSGATLGLAKMMEETYGIPYIRVSYFGVEDMADALYQVASFFGEADVMERTKALVSQELAWLYPALKEYRRVLSGKRAAIYVGGAFKAFSLIKAFRLLDMKVVLVGSQTGTKEDYEELERITDPGTVIVDDSNPLELSHFLSEKQVDIFVGGVKERPIAYKLGIAFCDHNHERKEALEGFVGMYNFAKEVHSSVMSPVWRFVGPRPSGLGVDEGRDASLAAGGAA